jgi:predicted aspartyl protease
MRTKVGTFRYPVEIYSAKGERSEELRPWVDTGALYSQFPAATLEELGYKPNASRTFRLADGRVVERPIGDVIMQVGHEVRATTCVFGEEGSEHLLGAVTLEQFGLAPDPVNETLVPVVAMLL